jgi:uncharacterized membrane protein
MGETMGGMAGQMMDGGMMSGGWTGAGMLWFALLALALIVAIGLAIGVLVSRRSTGSAENDPREIVRRRFARGELSTEDFAEAMKTLG